jgi:hypothetical protein
MGSRSAINMHQALKRRAGVRHTRIPSVAPGGVITRIPSVAPGGVITRIPSVAPGGI